MFASFQSSSSDPSSATCDAILSDFTLHQVLLIPNGDSALLPTSSSTLLIHIETTSLDAQSACISPFSLNAILPGSIPVTPTVNCPGYETIPVAELVYFPLTSEVSKLASTLELFIDFNAPH